MTHPREHSARSTQSNRPTQAPQATGPTRAASPDVPSSTPRVGRTSTHRTPDRTPDRPWDRPWDPMPLASVQGTLALDLGPQTATPRVPLTAVPDAGSQPSTDGETRELERWTHRFTQAAVEIVGGDRPSSQLLRWTSAEVYADLRRRACLVARAGRSEPTGTRAPYRPQPVRPQVVSVRCSFVGPGTVEASARVRYGPRSRAVAMRFEQREDRWVCRALEFA